MSSILDSISEKERLDIINGIVKFRENPPSIREFVMDDYFLGDVVGKKIYPFWMETLEEVFPNNLESKPTIIVKGGIGCGKSFFSTIVLLYDIAKLVLMDDPEQFFSLSFKKGVAFKFFSTTKKKSLDTLVTPVKNFLYNSNIPFFKEYLGEDGIFDHKVHLSACSRLPDLISEDVYSVILSELNFIPVKRAWDILEQVFSRLDSRFRKGLGLFNHVIIDSSDTEIDSVVETFIRKSPYAREEKCKVISTPIWEVKKGQGIYFNTGSFKVYAGDSDIDPFIMEDMTDIEELDEDRIITVPEELRPNYESDIQLALKDTAGVSIYSNSLYFSNLHNYSKCFNLKSNVDDVICLDFYDNERLFPYIEKAVQEIPIERKIYCRLDLGVVNDNAGIAIGYTESYGKRQIGERDVSVGVYKIPIVFAVSRYPDQETCISKVFDFFIELNQVREIAEISTDQYQSTQLRQDLIREGFKAVLKSVDRTTYSYSVSKRLINEGRLHIARNEILYNEGRHLVYNGDKVDHKSGYSKDLWDAVSGVVSSLYDSGEASTDNSSIKSSEDFVELVKMMKHNRLLRQGGY